MQCRTFRLRYAVSAKNCENPLTYKINIQYIMGFVNDFGEKRNNNFL